MKKQFITGVLLMALTAGGMSTFTSCKDTDEDQINDLTSQTVILRKALGDLKDQLENCSANCAGEIERLQKLIDGLEADKVTAADVDSLFKELAKDYALKSDLDALEKRVADLENQEIPTVKNQFTDAQYKTLLDLITLESQLQGLFGENGTIAGINTSIAGINTSIAGINTSIEALEDAIFGKDGENGLIDKVDGLSKWFEGVDWTVAEFQEYVSKGAWLISNETYLNTLVDLVKNNQLQGEALDELNKYYNDFAGVDEMYKAIFEGVEAPEEGWWNYATVIENIKNNSAAIDQLQEDVKVLNDRLNSLVTSLVLQATTNPVFGSFNSPFGVNSMVLMTYYGDIATSVENFPVAVNRGQECYDDNLDIDWTALGVKEYAVLDESNTKYVVNQNADGNAVLGNLWFTVNPGTVDKLDLDGFAIVNSRDDEPVVKLAGVEKDDETVLKFGVGGRAAGNGNGLYRAEAVVAPADLDAIKVHIESGLVESLKSAVKNHTAADAVHMMEAIFNQLRNVCDANALRYKYMAPTSQNTDGSWLSTEQKVYSNYGLAATAFRPLSFATLKGTSIRHIPHFSEIKIDPSMVDLDLGTFTVDSKNFSLNLNFGEPEFGKLEDEIWVKTNVTLTSEDGLTTVSGEVKINIAEQAQEIQDNITGAIDEWLGADGGIDARVEKAIWYALFNDPNEADPKYPYDSNQPVGVVADLLNQVNNMTTNIQDKLDNLVDKINSDYLSKVNRLIEKYNSVADRINNALDDPNHYLQSVMFYSKGNGGLGFLSTNPNQPSLFKGNGDAIELFATTYNFETVCPTFKKVIAVTKVTKDGVELGADFVKAANKNLATVMNGDRNRAALYVGNATAPGAYKYEIAYQAIDYTGHTSTVKCYVQVNR